MGTDLLTLSVQRCPLYRAVHLVPKHVLGKTISQISQNGLIQSLAVKRPPYSAEMCVPGGMTTYIVMQTQQVTLHKLHYTADFCT